MKHNYDIAVGNFCGGNGHCRSDGDDRFKLHFKAGYEGCPLVNAAGPNADTLGQLADALLDGMLLSRLDYLARINP